VSSFIGRGPRVSEEQKKRIPVGQYFTEKWPVLHYGSVPRVDLKTWDFKVGRGRGAVRVRLGRVQDHAAQVDAGLLQFRSAGFSRKRGRGLEGSNSSVKFQHTYRPNLRDN